MDYSIRYAELDQGVLKYGSKCRFCGKDAILLNDEYYDEGLYCGCEEALKNEELSRDVTRTKMELKKYEDDLELLRYRNGVGLFYKIPESMIEELNPHMKVCMACGKNTHSKHCNCQFAEAYNDDCFSDIEKKRMVERFKNKYNNSKIEILELISGRI